MSQKVRVVLVGGGSGGHFYPLMSIAEALRSSAPDIRLYYFGPDAYDNDALLKNDIEYIWCPSGKQRRYASLQNFFDLFKILFGTWIAILKLFMIYPDVVMSKGGYTSVPVVIAAWILRIPIVVHESDAVPGKANILGGKHARYIAVSYNETLEKFPQDRVLLTGIPMRKSLLTPPTGSTSLPFTISGDAPVLLILGGSQGAERVNELILESLDELLPVYTIIHQTGAAHFDLVDRTATELITDPLLRARYHAVPFMSGEVLNSALHRAALVISRAGSGTIHEVAVHGKPSILIPIPEEISHDQRTNAYSYARTGGAIVMEEKNLHDGLLRQEIDRIMQDQGLYATMCANALAFAPSNASEEIARMIIHIGDEH